MVSNIAAEIAAKMIEENSRCFALSKSSGKCCDKVEEPKKVLF